MWKISSIWTQWAFSISSENTSEIGNQIKGELYKIKDEFIDGLDYFEGSLILYYKDDIEVTDGYFEYNVVTYFKTDKIALEDLENIKLLKKY